MATYKSRVLCFCTHNSARSQMVEGLLRHPSDDRYDVHSAGTEATCVRPLAVAVMADLGVNLSGQHSQTVDRYVGQPWDAVITVCDQAAAVCPCFPGAARQLRWSLPDPSRAEGDAAQQLAVYRQVRDAIQSRLEMFLQEVPPTSSAQR